MIEWIKFKGSTEEERRKEAILPCMVYSDEYVFSLYQNHLFFFMNCTHWAPLNLPEEEKWKRLHTFNTMMQNHPAAFIGDSINQEFDNIYSILNELRKR